MIGLRKDFNFCYAILEEMNSTQVITGIDIGTDTCTTLIAGFDPQLHKLRVLGVSAVPSRGVKKSQIIDLEQVLGALTDSLDAAERMAGIEVKSAYVSVSGAHINSMNSKGVVAVSAPDQEIAESDVTRVIEAARAISLPSDRELIHIIPKHFTVDSQEGIKDPIGMTGVRLETEAHIITGLSTTLRNIEKCVLDLGVQINGFVFAGLASSEVVLTETEKELGVVCIDIGAGTSAVCVFVDGALSFSTTIPVGARHITQDIALGCKVSLDSAEKIKLFLSSHTEEDLSPNPGESKAEFAKRKRQHDQVSLSELGILDTQEVISRKATIERIMVPRIKEIMLLLGEQLEKKQLFPLVPAGIVITGGGANTVMMADIAKHTLQLPARVGLPKQIQGLTSDINHPSYSTAVGLIEYGLKQADGQQISTSSFGSILGKLKLTALPKKFLEIFKSILP